MIKLRHIATLLLLFATTVATAKPRLVVNIVVSGMQQGDLNRYKDNFGEGGFVRLMNEGANFTECYADYAPTSPEAGLATLATGTTPSVHGICSNIRFDRSTNQSSTLCSKTPAVRDEVLNPPVATTFTTKPFIAETFAEAVTAHNPRNRTITIAHNALSAMILAGVSGEAYWINDNGRWTTADCYAEDNPSWVRSFNNDDMNRVFATDTWYGRYTRDKYRNTRSTDITIYESDNTKQPRGRNNTSSSWVKDLCSKPGGNIALFEFAKRALGALLPLHIKEECKVLNICLDIPRYVAERYGSDSIEYEDMLYSLDASLSEFLTFLYAQTPSNSDLLITLSSDGGISPTTESNSDATRFSTRQFEVIMNAFLSARYGQDSWVTGYADGSLYLNHDVIYRHKKSVADVQNEVATFAMQFRGVANAVTATTIRNSQFTHGAISLVQKGYNPRTSGDVLIILDPKRIEQDSQRVAMSGSIYNYDRHIPFIVCGGDIKPCTIDKRITNDQIAPTIAKIVGVARPLCSESEIVVMQYNK